MLGRLINPQAASLGLGIEAGQRLAQRKRGRTVEPQAFGHDGGPKGQDRRPIDENFLPAHDLPALNEYSRRGTGCQETGRGLAARA